MCLTEIKLIWNTNEPQNEYSDKTNQPISSSQFQPRPNDQYNKQPENDYNSNDSRIFRSVIQPMQSFEDSVQRPSVDNRDKQRSNFGESKDANSEIIENKDRQINILQEEKRRLETELGDMRARILNPKVIQRPETQAKGFETWQIVAVLIVAIFLGYMIGTK